MATRKFVKAKKEFRAKLVGENDVKLPCAFCGRAVFDEVVFGKLYAIGDIQCHYLCALLSCCLIQKGRDEEGLFGFLYKDILTEVERCKKHKCSYCSQMGANLGCTVSQCRKQFHLPCGREKNAVTMFYGNFKSYCQQHAPKQKIPENIMAKARLRMPKKNKPKETKSDKTTTDAVSNTDADFESVCVICYEEVDTYPTVNTFWPPCCGKDAWFHRSCLQRMSLSAGMHYLKCPLCNDKDNFYNAVIAQGYYVPDRDAAWELEENAFQEIYSRVLTCSIEECRCPRGRSYDSDSGIWDITPCALCGAMSAHLACYTHNDNSEVKINEFHENSNVPQENGNVTQENSNVTQENSNVTQENSNVTLENSTVTQGNKDVTFVCDTCKAAAKDNLDSLLESVNKMILQEQTRVNTNSRQSQRRQVMPSRMSLRSTKQRILPQPSTSRSASNQNLMRNENNAENAQSNTIISRLELNLKPVKQPKSLLHQIPLSSVETWLLSPLKLLEQGLNEKMNGIDSRNNITLNSHFVIELMRQKFRKPKPMSEKRKIINDILEGLFNNHIKESPKSKTPLKTWTTPKKYTELVKTNENVTQQCNTEGITPEKSKNSVPELVISEQFETKEKTPKKSKKFGENNIESEANGVKRETCDKINEEFENFGNSINSISAILKGDRKSSINQSIVFEVSSDSSFNANEELFTNEEDINKTQDTNSTNVDDDDSRSTFELPPEFIAASDESRSMFETPKKIINVDIVKDSSLEISNEPETVKIDVFKTTESPQDKVTLWNRNYKLDMESFKSNYLMEVGDKKCSFGHKHAEQIVFETQLKTAIDFAIDAAMKNGDGYNLKRRSENVTNDEEKKMHLSESREDIITSKNFTEGALIEEREPRNRKAKRKSDDSSKEKKKRKCKRYNENVIKSVQKYKSKHKKCRESTIESESKVETIEITSESCDDTTNNAEKHVRKKKKSKNTRISIRDHKIKLKIQLKRDKLKLKISKHKTNERKLKNPKLMQYVLKCVDNATEVLAKPTSDVTPAKRKYNKTKKTPDNLKQTSIASFFSKG